MRDRQNPKPPADSGWQHPTNAQRKLMRQYGIKSSDFPKSRYGAAALLKLMSRESQ